jgi:hypothetical protein
MDKPRQATRAGRKKREKFLKKLWQIKNSF